MFQIKFVDLNYMEGTYFIVRVVYACVSIVIHFFLRK